MSKIKLVPIAMIVPTKEHIYAPSRIEPEVEISQEEFNLDYADSGKSGKVSFAKDGVSNPKNTTVFSGWSKMRGRFIVK